MLVMLTKNQLLAPRQVCQTCLLADRRGQPRWRQGQLCCGRLIHKTAASQPQQYECRMGFRIANIE